MKITIAKHSGFCKGVEHAVNTALSLKTENVYVLGEIIHNSEVVKTIADRGIVQVESLDEIPDGATVIFRSHGVPKNFYGICAERNINVIDCTCAFVGKTQKIVESESSAGKTVIIVGEPEHPEVKGLLGWCDNSAYVINSENSLPDDISQKNVCVVCQTTFSAEKFEKIIKNIRKVCEKTVEVFKTICYTTVERQNETEALSESCEAMLVIGGQNSSNTNKLYEIALKHCGNVFRIVNTDNFDYTKLKKFKSVGIVSGASTPNQQTREVLLKMAESTEVKAENAMDEAIEKFDNESRFKKGQKVTATISQANEDGLLILLPYSKKEVALSKDDLDCEQYNPADYTAKIGSPIDLLVVDLKPSLKLSQKMIKVLQEEEALLADIEAGKTFTVACTGTNKGGLVAKFGTYSVFVPAREIRPGFVKDLNKYVGRNLRLRCLEIRKTGRKEIIASQRVILQEERDAKEAAKAAKEQEFFANIAVGDVVEGKVERTTSFGAFVSVRGFDCLAHISDLSWAGAEKVEDVLEIGKTYKFKVLKVDQNNKKVSIGYKQLQPQPWELVDGKYSLGDVVHGKVVRIVPFGAFVEVEKGVDGLIHVSQLRYERVETPNDVLNVGDEVDAKIIALDPEAKKMNLSLKALAPEPERKPRAPKGEPSEDDGKKARAPRRVSDDELSNWSEGSIVGTSLGDIIENAKKK